MGKINTINELIYIYIYMYKPKTKAIDCTK